MGVGGDMENQYASGSYNDTLKKQRLLSIITNPINHFRQLKVNPIILKPLLIVIALQIILIYLNLYITNKQESGNVDLLLKSLVAGGANVVLLLLTALLFRFLLYLLKNNTEYKKLFSIVIHAAVITVVGMCVNTLLTYTFGGAMHTYTSPAIIFEEGSFLYTLSVGLDIFSIWTFIIMGIGLKVVAEISNSKAVTLTILLFVLSFLSTYLS